MKKLLLSALFLILMQISCFAASSPTISPPLENGVAQGTQNCVENVSICTNTAELQNAFARAMSIAKISLDNFVDYLYSLLNLSPLPQAPQQPGMPSVSDTPIVKTIPCPNGSTPQTCDKQP